jgi:hypothetical protein
MTTVEYHSLRLQDVLQQPPLPALLSISMLCGIAYLGWGIARVLRRGKPDSLDLAAGYVLAASVVAALAHGVAIMRLFPASTLRIAGWALAATGICACIRNLPRGIRAIRDEAVALGRGSWLKRAGVVFVGLIITGLAAAALGPVTDADSLDYHIGVPLDWLQHGGAYADNNWFTSRLVGIAEALNMLGLAAGTDGLGAALQFGGLIAVAVALRSLASNSSDRLLAWLLVAACPVMVFLVPNQKPQLLPSAATAIAMVLVIRRYSSFGRIDALMALGCAAFAAASKLSFLYSAGLVVLVCLDTARRRGNLASVLAIGTATFGVFLLPLWWRNYSLYGDPLSPFLERFLSHPDPATVHFAAWLRAGLREHTLANCFHLFTEIFVTTRPGYLSTTLGLGALAFVPVLLAKETLQPLLWAALGCVSSVFLLSSLEARYFLEPYLWIGAALVRTRPTKLKSMLLDVLSIQAALVAFMALSAAAILFPGAWTSAGRHKVMSRSAVGYSEAQWLDQVLPADAKVLSQMRSHAFVPRPFVLVDSALFDSLQPDLRLSQLVTAAGVDTLVLQGAADSAYLRLSQRCGKLIAGPRQFAYATRNPLNRRQGEPVRVFQLQNCAF